VKLLATSGGRNTRPYTAEQERIAHQPDNMESLPVLILSRRKGESFWVGDQIKITVLSQRSNQVRIGIDAPRSMPVHREEVLRRDELPPEAKRLELTLELADTCD
jgi:carbon storage regulator